MVALAGLVAGACTGSHQKAAPATTTAAGPEITTTTSTPAALPSTTAVPATDLKPVLQGIVLIDQVPSASSLGDVGGVALSISWQDLQPTQGGPIAAGNALDQTVAQVRELNRTQHANVGIRFRILAGIDAPDWVKNIGGPPVDVTAVQDGITGTVGRFWTDAFGHAYEDLQAKLAAKYDDVPEVREVTVSRCTTVFAEPLVRQSSDPATVASFQGAGYTDAADAGCQRGQIEAHQVWRHTRTGMAFNPYQHVGGGLSDSQTSILYMQYCRQILGARCVLENNSIRWPVLSGGYPVMYQAMFSLGPPLSFQTAGPSRIGDLAVTLTWAAQNGANAVELSPGMFGQAIPGLGPIVARLRHNPAG
jgi:hypothetical protein